MSLCLVAIFKNESHILNEFVKHYIKQGVDHFFFIDNGSNDNYEEQLKEFNGLNIITLSKDPVNGRQAQHYNRYCLKECKQYDWCIVCDLDEFIYARKGMKTIKDYLNTLSDDISEVHIPWKIFGSSGFNTPDKKQPDNVVKSFTKRTNYDKRAGFQGVTMLNNDKYSLAKCIVRTKHLSSLWIHSHTVTNKSIGSDNNEFIHPSKNCYKIDETILENSFLHLNHYAIQSYEWFMRVKATRGDVYFNKNCRDAKYFKEFDDASNDIDDFELASM